MMPHDVQRFGWDNWIYSSKSKSFSPLYTVGLNQFSDMTFTEFKKFYLLKEPQVLCFCFFVPFLSFICVCSGLDIKRLSCPTWQECNATKGNHVTGVGLYPDSIDWRMKGQFVSEVKNQVISWTSKQLKSTLNNLNSFSGIQNFFSLTCWVYFWLCFLHYPQCRLTAHCCTRFVFN